MKLALKFIVSLILLSNTIPAIAGVKADSRERAQKASSAFREIMDAPDQAIPEDLIDRAQCVAVFPSVIKAGFIIGGLRGKGLVSCRRSGGSWGAPSYLTISGGSFGLQFGGQAVDLVMLIMNEQGIEGLLQDKFEIGAGAAASAGPVGRNTHVSTDILLKSQIISYSRSRGLFAGLELKGAVINQDQEANNAMYGRELSARDIVIDGKARTPSEIRIFPQTLRKFSAVLVSGK